MKKTKGTIKDCSDHIPPWGEIIIASVISFILGILFCAKLMRSDKNHSNPHPTNPPSISESSPQLERVVRIDDPELERKWDEDAAKRRLKQFGTSAEPPGYRSSTGGTGHIDAETKRIAKEVYDFVNDPPDQSYEITVTPE